MESRIRHRLLGIPTDALFLSLLGALCALRALHIGLKDLSWGLMDDAAWSDGFARTWGHRSFWTYLTEQLASDQNWGLVRPTYFTWSYWVYGWMPQVLGASPSWVYALCFLNWILASGLWGWALSRFFPTKGVSAREAMVIFAIAFLSFGPSLNFVNLISLQERLAVTGFGISFAAAAVLLTGKPRHRWLPHRWLPHRWLPWTAVFLGCALALGAKVTAFVFLIPLLGIIVSRRALPSHRTDRWIAACLAVLAGSWVLWTRTVSSHGSYTSAYSLAAWLQPTKVVTFLSRFVAYGGVWAFAVPLALVLFAVLRKEKERWLWIAGISLWFFTMLPWGIFGYYWGLATPFWALASGSILIAFRERYLRERSKLWLQSVLLVVLTVVIGPRLERLLARSEQTKQATTWLQTIATERDQKIWINPPCEEARGALPILTRRPGDDFAVWNGSLDSLRTGDIVAVWWECSDMTSQARSTLKLTKDFGAWRFYTLPHL